MADKTYRAEIDQGRYNRVVHLLSDANPPAAHTGTMTPTAVIQTVIDDWVRRVEADRKRRNA